jgi:hypothetical protein
MMIELVVGGVGKNEWVERNGDGVIGKGMVRMRYDPMLSILAQLLLPRPFDRHNVP